MDKNVITDHHVLYAAIFLTHLGKKKHHSSDAHSRLRVMAMTSEIKHIVF